MNIWGLKKKRKALSKSIIFLEKNNARRKYRNRFRVINEMKMAKKKIDLQIRKLKEINKKYGKRR